MREEDPRTEPRIPSVAVVEVEAQRRGSHRRTTGVVTAILMVLLLAVVVRWPAWQLAAAAKESQPVASLEEAIPVALAEGDDRPDIPCVVDLAPPAAEVPEGWELVTTAPQLQATVTTAALAGQVLVLTGSGSPQAEMSRPFLYDPAADAWSCLPTAPISAAKARFTTTGVAIHAAAKGRAARFDVEDERWRSDPAPPGGRTPRILEQVGQSRVAWGLRSGGYDADGAVLRDSQEAWSPLAAAPWPAGDAATAWTGKDLVLVADGRAAVYDPVADTWMELAANHLTREEVAAVVTGDRVVAYDDALRSGFYDLADGAWHGLPDLPLTDGECLPDLVALEDGGAMALYCGQAARFDAATETWTAIPTPAWEVLHGTPGRLPNPPMAVGGDVYILEETRDRQHRLWRYTP